MEKTQYYERYNKLAVENTESLLRRESPKKSNIAKIYFRDVPGAWETKVWIEITGFENFKSGLEIEKAYGKGVRENYRRERYRMYGKENGKAIYFSREKRLIEVGDKIVKSAFLDVIVPEARKCGVVLSRIIKDSKKPEIHCIEI